MQAVPSLVPLYATASMRVLAFVNQRTVREPGPLSSGGLSVQPKRKPATLCLPLLSRLDRWRSPA